MGEVTPHQGHPPITMRRVENDDAIERAGDFCWEIDDDATYLLFTVPSPRDGKPSAYVFQRLPVKQGQNVTGRHWGWNGNEDKPTLTPSVHTIGHWHGWVRDGTLVEV